jgi:hypothetical protein
MNLLETTGPILPGLAFFPPRVPSLRSQPVATRRNTIVDNRYYRDLFVELEGC